MQLTQLEYQEMQKQRLHINRRLLKQTDEKNIPHNKSTIKESQKQWKTQEVVQGIGKKLRYMQLDLAKHIHIYKQARNRQTAAVF